MADDTHLNFPQAEGKILKFWEEKKIFEKSLEKTRNGKPFTFYDGPPFATGLPHYGHILASTIKDVIPRYQTMKGRFVRRRWGWDCHGLPIEEVVERYLGISGKKQIEEIGIEKFNRICREKVLEFADEWGKMVRRIARWVDFDNSYKTMDRDYMESVWWAFKDIYEKGLVYEGRKVLMYCPRCETPVSNFEVAMDNSYQDVVDEAVTVRFKLVSDDPEWQNTSFLSWTTTPWTLPGNVALAINPKHKFVCLPDPAQKDSWIVLEEESQKRLALQGILPKLDTLPKEEFDVFNGDELLGLSYESLFDVPLLRQGSEGQAAFKVYPADFVSTEEGTGIVHTAVVYGEDDYALGMREGLPVVPLLDEKGKFNDKAPEFLRGIYFKDADKVVIADLEKQELLFKKEKYSHSYPHCWRCGNPLFYNAIPAWFVNIQKIKKELIDSNNKEVNWFPAHLKHGRYEKSVEQAPDWNISRNRYWGNPIPVWKCESGCPPIVVGSIKELGLSSNTFYFSRHGEAKSNVLDIIAGYPEKQVFDLTEAGVTKARMLGEKLKEAGGVDMIFSSDLLRTKHTAEIVAGILSVPVEFDERLREYNQGVYNGRLAADFEKDFSEKELWTRAPEGGETWTQLQERMVNFIREVDKKHKNKRVLVISHGDPLWMIQKYYGSELGYPNFAEPFKIEVGIADIHRPYVDEVVLKCSKCGKEARRVKEIFDSWIESGSMPFAEYHYPFDQKEIFESRFPAQFVAEYIAQTRSWFYLMHVVSLILFGKAPFENVVTTGTILAEDGSKMSKSKRNFPDPWLTIEKYGVDALRFYLMNAPVMQADNLNFSVRDLEVVYRKVVVLLWNVWKYFDMYAKEARWERTNGRGQIVHGEAINRTILDQWILIRAKELVASVGEYFDRYDTVQATRIIGEYIEDLSTWYLRRSRGRKDEAFFATLRETLIKTSQVVAPVMPYLSEFLYLDLTAKSKEGGYPESVHLTDWPETEELSEEEKSILRDMEIIREAASIGQAARKSLKIPVRQPLPRLAFSVKNGNVPQSELLEILLGELNVKKFDPLISQEKNQDIFVAPGTASVMNFHFDTSISEELRLEGLLRGLERGIQELRKKQGFKVGEMAELYWKSDDEEIKKALEMVNEEKIYLSSVKEDMSASEALEIDGKKLFLSLIRS